MADWEYYTLEAFMGTLLIMDIMAGNCSWMLEYGKPSAEKLMHIQSLIVKYEKTWNLKK